MCTATDHWFDQMIANNGWPLTPSVFVWNNCCSLRSHDRRELWHFETAIMRDDLTDDQASDLMRAYMIGNVASLTCTPHHNRMWPNGFGRCFT